MKDIAIETTPTEEYQNYIEEKENFVVEMDKYIAEKCEYGDSMETLNVEQRILYITQALEMEVNNGGFSQYFFNSGISSVMISHVVSGSTVP